MLKLHQILARGLLAIAAAPLLSACGQKGVLFLPTDPIARGRATLPQTVVPGLRRAPAAAPAATPDPAVGGAVESPSTTVTPSTPARPVAAP